MVTREEYELAIAKGRVTRETELRAVKAYYDRKAGRMVLELANRLGLTFAPEDVEGLENAKPKDLEQVELCMDGQGLFFPTIDADVFVPGLVEGIFGSRRWMAARLGQAGGQAKSEAKAKASRENGKRGGRPRKAITSETKGREELATYVTISNLSATTKKSGKYYNVKETAASVVSASRHRDPQSPRSESRKAAAKRTVARKKY